MDSTFPPESPISYFARTGEHSNKARIREMLGEQADWSINECVAKNDTCTFLSERQHFGLMTKFFCGHDAVCQEVSQTLCICAWPFFFSLSDPRFCSCAR